MYLKIFTLILIGFIGSVWCSNNVFADKTSSSKPLVLQMEISHPRNVDQTSLIFREKTVDFVTNSFQRSYQQKSSEAHLGHFTRKLNNDFKVLKKQITSSVKKKRNSKNKNTTKNDQVDQMIPHAPVIRVGEDGRLLTFTEGDAHFGLLKNILSKARDKKWTCVSCARYKRSGKSIVRIIKKKGRNKASSRAFSRKNLKCIDLNKNRIECVDPQFGIFEL